MVESGMSGVASYLCKRKNAVTAADLLVISVKESVMFYSALVCLYVYLFVCLSVSTITQKVDEFLRNFCPGAVCD